MALLGTLILLFLIVHLAHFWVKTRITELDTSTPVMMNEGHELENLFSEMVLVFQSPLIVVIYVLGCISLAWHLIHGFKSAFQTFGLNHKRYNGLISMTGIAFSILVSLVFAAMPVSMYLGWIK